MRVKTLIVALVVMYSVCVAQVTGTITGTIGTPTVVQVPTPTFSPDGGSAAEFTLSMSDSVPGATISYCSGASDCDPASGGSTYSGSIHVTESAHYCAYATASGMTRSDRHCATFSVVVPGYLVEETFESTTADTPPTGWSGIVSYSQPNWHDGTQYKGGSYALAMDNSANANEAITPTFSMSGGTVFAKYWMRLDHYPTSANILLGIHSGSNNVAFLKLYSDGRMFVCAYQGANCTNDYFSEAVPLNTWVRLWMRYDVGTGTNSTYQVWWSTADSFPGNSDAKYYAVSSDGTYTTKPTAFHFVQDSPGTVKGVQYLDDIVISESQLW